jgi:hypothetical protein
MQPHTSGLPYTQHISPPLFPEIRRKEVRDGICDRIRLVARGAMKGTSDYLLLILFIDLEIQVPLAQRTGKDIHQFSFHYSTTYGVTPFRSITAHIIYFLGKMG